ncbi:hypothetical protein GCM10022224_019470 [Nonomuraea antimicrobica]|uniref:Secreted protein n=1 Tax=Nonomuraea antimicrobica TaxID=561173 RepID=A0ABP7BCC9_9ACTN
MYRSVIAAVTMTAAALLLASAPAIADDDDFRGPHIGCEKEAAGFVKLRAPLVIWFGGSDDCKDEEHEEHHDEWYERRMR